ncbi:MAG: UbiA prenyltransferase family-domain-containing protein [Lentinula lateritia]|nr:MAG: UbiA prenyltransferase family-domain-containing protein [Lentinula lateritia]
MSSVSKPSALNNYYRLARMHAPVGTFLFFWPFAYALLMSAYKTNMPLSALITRLVVYGVGSLTLRSAACVWNDICDVDFDRQVERTKVRPLASGAVSMAGAYTYLISLTLAFVATLYMLESKEAFYQGVFDVAVLNLIYPLMKRVTYLPQAWLGLAINWGFVVAWVDVSGRSVTSWHDFEVLAYGMVSLASWTIVYDTIYACQDLNDDKRAGVKSTALLFGSYLPAILRLFAAIYIGSLAYIGYLNGQGAWFYGVSVIGSAVHMLWQLGTHNPMNAANCKERFDSNINLGGIVTGGLLVDYLVRVVI